jgi:deoxyhypusine monooxygenase
VRHELAYVLGQLQNPAACGVLARVLDDGGEDTMVRHECAEALGAIGSAQSLPVLLRGTAATATAVVAVAAAAADVAAAAAAVGTDAAMEGEEEGEDAEQRENPTEVRETCAIAVDLIRWKVGGRVGEAPLHCACMSPYSSIDPAPAMEEVVVEADVDPESVHGENGGSKVGVGVAAAKAAAPPRLTTPELEQQLRDEARPLFERYRAMFSLRNRAPGK